MKNTLFQSTFLIILGLVALMAFLPIGIGLGTSNLQPKALSETVTAFAPTDATFRTREAQEQLSATSVITFSTLEDYEAFSQEVADEPSLVPTAEFVPPPIEITGVALVPIAISSCPSANPEYQSDSQLPANEEFIVLGWNIDLDNNVYFLIDDDPTQSQVWVGKTVDVTLSSEEYQRLYPTATSCRTWTATPNSGASATPTIPLPVARTATPLPPIEAVIQMTNDEATDALKESTSEIKDPRVTFVPPDGIKITGEVEIDGPLGVSIDGDVEMEGKFLIVDKKLQVDLTSIEVEGRDLTDDERGQLVENMVNNWLIGLLVQKDVQRYEVLDDMLLVNVLERQNSILPTLAVTPTPMPLLTPDAQGVLPITGEYALLVAAQSLPQISDLQISFTPEAVQISGKFSEPLNDLPDGAEIVAIGTLSVIEGKLQLDLSTLTLNAVPLLGTAAGDELIGLLNNWMQALSLSYEVNSAAVNNGVLEVTIVP